MLPEIPGTNIHKHILISFLHPIKNIVGACKLPTTLLKFYKLHVYFFSYHEGFVTPGRELLKVLLKSFLFCLFGVLHPFQQLFGYITAYPW